MAMKVRGGQMVPNRSIGGKLRPETQRGLVQAQSACFTAGRELKALAASQPEYQHIAAKVRQAELALDEANAVLASY